MNSPIVIEIDKDMQDLVPLFVKQREIDLGSLDKAIANSDYESVRKVGHSLAGAGSSYGFHRVSEIGEALEIAAKSGTDANILAAFEELKDYMARLIVKYV
jgi:histidine phosphotransfer protein HptB